MAKRLLRAIGIGVAGAGVVLGVEIQMARGAERIDGYARRELDGTIGTGAPLRVVWIGDSTGDGVGASSPDHVLPRVVARGLGRQVHLSVLAHSGDRVGDAIRDQAPLVAALEPDWVFIAIGSNDVIHLTSRSKVREGLRRLIDAVAATGPDRIIVLGPGHFAGTPLLAEPLRWIAGMRARQINGVVESVARESGALFVDIIGRVGSRFVDDPARLHARDRFHPSDEGYGLWATATLDALRETGAL